MIIPEHWAEAKICLRENGKQITLRRFGWSDDSFTNAQHHAEQRLQEAVLRYRQGSQVSRREEKVPYNGAEGLPIREEVVDRIDDVVLTRNSYGAVCLNSSNLFIADIDFGDPVSRLQNLTLPIAVLLAVAVGWTFQSLLFGFATLCLALFAWLFFVSRVRQWMFQNDGYVERRNLDRIHRFWTAHPDWGLRIYRTPNGYRVIATHRNFEPSDPMVDQCFAFLQTDPQYRRMCQKQQCFRARVTGKPWRMGIQDHMRPRPGVWPVEGPALRMRQQWLQRYDQVAPQFAACHFEQSLGPEIQDPAIQSVVALHDRLSQATSDLPMA
jgi:hypothetical protein